MMLFKWCSLIDAQYPCYGFTCTVLRLSLRMSLRKQTSCLFYQHFLSSAFLSGAFLYNAFFIQRPFCTALFWSECRLKPRYFKKRVIKEHFNTRTISRGPLSTQHQSIFVVLTQTLFRYVRAPLWAKTQSYARVVQALAKRQDQWAKKISNNQTPRAVARR